MDITSNLPPSWLLLVFTLPSARASERVQIWRRLQKLGSIPFRNAGYMLPHSADNGERFEWLARTIRDSGGEASILEIQSIDDTPDAKLKELFREGRAADYAALLTEIEKPAKKAQTARLRRRFEDITRIDFFDSPLRANVERALVDIENAGNKIDASPTSRLSKADYQKRIWVTRPRPGIDRVSSAWLISRFIDPKAKFTFTTIPEAESNAIPFDMYSEAGFGHRGDRCTFETLCHAFGIVDQRVALIGQAIHDADLEDDKFGRSEGHTMNKILRGWAQGNLPDKDLLQRGIDLIEGLYNSVGIKPDIPRRDK